MLAVTDSPRTPLGGDLTRRFAVDADGVVLLPGLTRPEAARACEWMATVDPRDLPLVLAEVTLPVVLTDGAGPHLLDASGALVLALGPHPRIVDGRVAMGEPDPDHAVGVVRCVTGDGWVWLARAEVAAGARVAALDALDTLTDVAGLAGWAAANAGVTSTLVP